MKHPVVKILIFCTVLSRNFGRDIYPTIWLSYMYVSYTFIFFSESLPYGLRAYKGLFYIDFNITEKLKENKIC